MSTDNTLAQIIAKERLLAKTLADASHFMQANAGKFDSHSFETFVTQLINEIEQFSGSAPAGTINVSWEDLKKEIEKLPRLKPMMAVAPEHPPVRPLTGVTEGIHPVRSGRGLKMLGDVRPLYIGRYKASVFQELIDRLDDLRKKTRTGWNMNLEKGLPPFETYAEALAAIRDKPALSTCSVRAFMLARMARGVLDIKNTLHLPMTLQDEFRELFNDLMDIAYELRSSDSRLSESLQVFNAYKVGGSTHSAAACALALLICEPLKQYDELHSGYLDHLKSQTPDTPYGMLHRMRELHDQILSAAQRDYTLIRDSFREHEIEVISHTLRLIIGAGIPDAGYVLTKHKGQNVYSDGKGFLTLVETPLV